MGECRCNWVMLVDHVFETSSEGSDHFHLYIQSDRDSNHTLASEFQFQSQLITIAFISQDLYKLFLNCTSCLLYYLIWSIRLSLKLFIILLIWSLWLPQQLFIILPFMVYMITSAAVYYTTYMVFMITSAAIYYTTFYGLYDNISSYLLYYLYPYHLPFFKALHCHDNSWRFPTQSSKSCPLHYNCGSS